MRKIVQIDSSSVANPNSKAEKLMLTALFALADDGTCWVFKTEEPRWKQVPEIPQEKQIPKP